MNTRPAVMRKSVYEKGVKKSNCGNIESMRTSIPLLWYSAGMSEIAILLHNIRSAHNVGSIFRTADAAGAGKIYLSGYTPRPIDRFGRPQKEIAKTALGAQLSIT